VTKLTTHDEITRFDGKGKRKREKYERKIEDDRKKWKVNG
jgi:hypothetical protein